MYASGRRLTCLYRPFFVCSPSACGSTHLDVDPRACTGPFLCVRPLHVGVRLWDWIDVPVRALFDVFAVCTWVYASGRLATYPYRPFSVCWPCARGCMPMDVACTGPFRYVGPVNVVIRLWTWTCVPLPALFRVFALLYASGRASTRLYRERGCTPLGVYPPACTGPLLCVGPMHVAVPL